MIVFNVRGMHVALGNGLCKSKWLLYEARTGECVNVAKDYLIREGRERKGRKEEEKRSKNRSYNKKKILFSS